MLFRLKRAVRRWGLDRAHRAVLRAPPVTLQPQGVLVVTQLRRIDLRGYLLAIQSFARHVPVAEVRVIDDGSLGPAEHRVLHEHVPAVTLVPIASIPCGDCPRGGTWERLLHILDLSTERYVVQLDADILVTAPLPEVTSAIAANRPFTLSTDPWVEITSTAEAAAAAAHEPIGATQVACERALAVVPPALGARYVRGSSGFAGFARGAATRAQAEALSRAMRAQLGVRWDEWGTEQVASNFLVANAPGASLLPWPEYCCFYGGAPDPRTRLFHFLGTWRFEGGVYARLGRAVAEDLARG